MRPLRLLAAAIAGGASIAFALHASPPPAGSSSPGAASSSDAPVGRVIVGPVDVYTFSPSEHAVPVDAERADLRRLFEDLGPDAIRWHQHLVTLSNPYFEGRLPGSPGIERAAAYIEYWLGRIGLEPAFSGSHRQPFELAVPAEALFAALSVDGEALEENEAFLLLGNSGSAEGSGELAFVGYGIEGGPEGYDSFAAAGDLAGKVVMVLRYEPLDEQGRSRWSDRRYSRHSALAAKFAAIERRGAAGILLVNPPDAAVGARDLQPPPRGGLGDQLSIPAMQVSPAVASRLLASIDPDPDAPRSLLEWRRLADEGRPLGSPAGRPAQIRLAAEFISAITTDNVAGVLPGAGDLASEWVVVGAHYDHMGVEGTGGGFDPRHPERIFPGADDNASGTAAMLVLAERFEAISRSAAEPNRRSILFIAFSAEEGGLHGSRHFVRNPTMPADAVVAMLNLDMVGRLRSDELLVGGVGTAEGFLDRLQPHFERSGLLIRADPSGRAPSDHSNFHGAGIPVLFFFTGVHGEYHQPGDEGHTVNPAGAAKVIRLVEGILHDLATGPGLSFSTGAPAAAAAAPRSGYAAVRLGVMPGLGEGEAGGLRVEGVSPGTSADEAGIRAGDVMLSWNGSVLHGAGDLVARLREHQPGDAVTIVIRRDGQEHALEVVLQAGGGPPRPE